MFKHILIILLILVLVYFIIKYFKFKLHLDHNVKYLITDDLESYSENGNLFDISTLSIFYTTKPWSTKNNNYLKYKDRYYIIEPGYYYYIHPETELFLNNNCKVKFLKKK